MSTRGRARAEAGEPREARTRVRAAALKAELAGGSKVVEMFGSNTFDVSAMKEKLPKPVYKSLQETIRSGTRLDPAIANEVAHAVKEWRHSIGYSLGGGQIKILEERSEAKKDPDHSVGFALVRS